MDWTWLSYRKHWCIYERVGQKHEQTNILNFKETGTQKCILKQNYSYNNDLLSNLWTLSATITTIVVKSIELIQVRYRTKIILENTCMHIIDIRGIIK